MVDKKEEVEVKKENKDAFETAEIATQTAMVVRNKVNGDVLDQPQILTLILNKLEKLERGLL